MTEIESIKARIAELDRAIAEYPRWGAALTAMDEERRGLEAALSSDLPQTQIAED